MPKARMVSGHRKGQSLHLCRGGGGPSDCTRIERKVLQAARLTRDIDRIRSLRIDVKLSEGLLPTLFVLAIGPAVAFAYCISALTTAKVFSSMAVSFCRHNTQPNVVFHITSQSNPLSW